MADDTMAARFAKLEAQVLELERKLEQDRTRFGSMRDTRRCPACGGGSLFHFSRITDVVELEWVEFALVRERKSIFRPILHRAPVEVYACRGCGLVEWHARNFDGVTADGEAIVAIEPEPAPPASGPFR